MPLKRVGPRRATWHAFAQHKNHRNLHCHYTVCLALCFGFFFSLQFLPLSGIYALRFALVFNLSTPMPDKITLVGVFVCLSDTVQRGGVKDHPGSMQLDMVRQCKAIQGWSLAPVKAVSLAACVKLMLSCAWCQAHSSPLTSSSFACSSYHQLPIFSFHFLYFSTIHLQLIVPPAPINTPHRRYFFFFVHELGLK